MSAALDPKEKRRRRYVDLAWWAKYVEPLDKNEVVEFAALRAEFGPKKQRIPNSLRP